MRPHLAILMDNVIIAMQKATSRPAVTRKSLRMARKSKEAQIRRLVDLANRPILHKREEVAEEKEQRVPSMDA